MKVSVNYRGTVRGLDKVLTAAFDAWKKKESVMETSSACEDFGRLANELAELAWICREESESGRHGEYEVEVFVTDEGLTWQRYRVAVVPRPSLAHVAWHGRAFGCLLKRVSLFIIGLP